MKKIFLLIITVALTVCCISCTDNTTDNFGGNKITDLRKRTEHEIMSQSLSELPYDEVITTTYSSQEFFEYFCREFGYGANKLPEELLTLSALNKRFPVECMRMVKSRKEGSSVAEFYVIYKLDNGNVIYAFFFRGRNESQAVTLNLITIAEIVKGATNGDVTSMLLNFYGSTQCLATLTDHIPDQDIPR